MNVRIIYCHPSNNSYTFEMLEQLLAHLDKEDLAYEITDLYAMNFKTDMSKEEYEREGLINLDLEVPQDVRDEQENINKADCIIFIYPVWWSDCPAKLKGWFDRVFSAGYAYSQDESKHATKMKTIKYGLAVCTAGHTNQQLDEIGIAESMRTVMIDDRLGQRFKHKEMIILGGTLDKEKARSTHAESLSSIGRKIKKYCAKY